MDRPAHQQRVVAELAELQDRIVKLQAFMDAGATQVDGHERTLMGSQLYSMTQYMHFLRARIHHWDR